MLAVPCVVAVFWSTVLKNLFPSSLPCDLKPFSLSVQGRRRDCLHPGRSSLSFSISTRHMSVTQPLQLSLSRYLEKYFPEFKLVAKSFNGYFLHLCCLTVVLHRLQKSLSHTIW